MAGCVLGLVLFSFVVSAYANLVTEKEFQDALTLNNYPRPSNSKYRNFIQRTHNGRITTKRELAMFLANIEHESAGLQFTEEWGPPPPGTYSHPPLDRPGKQYHGRGYIQLSYSYNYKSASEALYRDLRLLNNPEQVATNDATSWDVSYWYWSDRVHDKPGVQQGNFGSTIRAINGLECDWGNHHLARTRIRLYENVLRAFNIYGGSKYCNDPCDCVIPTSGGGNGGGGGGGGGSGCSQTYTVQPGDSFWSIANMHGMTTDQLQALNPSVTNPSTIYPGQVLCVRR